MLPDKCITSLKIFAKTQYSPKCLQQLNTIIPLSYNKCSIPLIIPYVYMNANVKISIEMSLVLYIRQEIWLSIILIFNLVFLCIQCVKCNCFELILLWLTINLRKQSFQCNVMLYCRL